MNIFLKSTYLLVSLIFFQCESSLDPQSLDSELTIENAGERHNEMTIGLWEYTVPACASYDIRCQLSTGNISNIKPSTPTGSTTYKGQLITSPCQFYLGGC